MQCSKCQHDNLRDVEFCSHCSTLLYIRCTGCEADLQVHAKFCHMCGESVVSHFQKDAVSHQGSTESIPRQIAEQVNQSQSAQEGELKLVSILFCDVVDSTALMKKLGPETWRDLVKQIQKLAYEVVSKFEGTVNQLAGDGIMALFGAPSALEDHAIRAVQAALAIQEAISTHSLGSEILRGQRISVRMGVSTGEVVVGKVGKDLSAYYAALGEATNVAAHLQGAADPGTIYISEHTQRGLPAEFQCEYLGPKLLKGKGEPVTVYKVSERRETEGIPSWWWRDPRDRGFGASMVGRDVELADLTKSMNQLKQGQGGVAFLFGEPGIGKSRLIAEVRRHVSDWGLHWLEGRSFSYSQPISYGPFLELIKNELGIKKQDKEALCWGKLERRMNELFLPEEVPEILPYLGALLGLNVREKFESRVKYLNSKDMGRQIFRSSRRFFQRLAQDHPVVLVFEDMHWTDEASVELLIHLLSLVNTESLLICWVSRPEFRESAVRLQTTAKEKYVSCYTETTLNPLSNSDSVSLVRQLLSSKELSLSPRFHEVTVGKAEGNPFFLEEVVRSLSDAGVLGFTQGTVDLSPTNQLDEITLPETIQGVIMARVDRLPEDTKQVLKLASVIGRNFFYRVLQNLTVSTIKLDSILDDLKAMDLIRVKTRSLDDVEYFFKHALVQEAIYDSILLKRRRELHQQVAEHIKGSYADRKRKEDYYSLLAYHYARAEMWEDAWDYLREAGDQAGQLAADVEALAHYEQAMSSYARFRDQWNPIERAAMERKIGEALFRRGEHHKAKDHLYRALEYLSAPYPRTSKEFRNVILKQLILQVTHRVWPSRVQTRPSLEVDLSSEERSLIYEALIWIDFFVDPKRFVLDSLLELNFSEQEGLPVGIVQGAFTFGLALDTIPLLSRFAEQYHRRNITLSEEINHPRAMGHAYLGLGIHEHYQGNASAALETLQRASDSYSQAGDLRGASASNGRKSRILGHIGEFGQAIVVAKEIINLGRDSGDTQAMAWGFALEGFVSRQQGDLDKAIILFLKAADLCPSIPDYQTMASVVANLGLCYLHQGNLEEAQKQMEISQRLLVEKSLRGTQITDARNHSAEIALMAVEQTDDRDRTALMKRATQICKEALVQSKMDPWGKPGAYRWNGTLAWLGGNQSKARRWWQQSLSEAENTGMPYESGVTHLEMGKRMNDQNALNRAEAAFSKLGIARVLPNTG